MKSTALVQPVSVVSEALMAVPEHTADDELPPCHRCGGTNSLTDSMNRNAPDDALQVAECRHCGSILGINGHQW